MTTEFKMRLRGVFIMRLVLFHRYIIFCRENNWKYIFTLKEGRTKNIWLEFEALKTLEDNSNGKCCTWINEIEYKENSVNVLEAKLTEDNEEKEFAFINAVGYKVHLIYIIQSGNI